MTPTVLTAIEGLKKAFPNTDVTVLAEDGQGGAFVRVEEVELGPAFAPSKTWVGAQLPSNLPYADVYPVFMVPGLTRADGTALPSPLSPVTWQEGPATQVSRRSNRLNGGSQAAVVKFVKVIEFVKGLA